VGAVGVVVRARGDQFDGVGAEDSEVAEIALPLVEVPAVVGVGLGAIAQLVPAQGMARRGREPESRREEDPPPRHPQLAEQPPDAEEHAAWVVADDEDRAVVLRGQDPVALRAARGGVPGEPPLESRVPGTQSGSLPDRDKGSIVRRGPFDLPADSAPSTHLLDQHRHRLLLGPRQVLRDDHDGFRQVEHTPGR
jgi:hypothetical protein